MSGCVSGCVSECAGGAGGGMMRENRHYVSE